MKVCACAKNVQESDSNTAMSKLAKLIALFLSFAGLLLGATNANAAACSAIATGNWNAQTTWGVAGTGCVGAPGGIPGAADTVAIPTTRIVTVTAAAAATSLTVTGTGSVVNNSTLTISGALGGTGGLTNSATGTLNLGGTSAITTLTAIAVGNIVNYTGAGQTVKATSYATLNVTGTATNSGTVTVATALGGTGTLTNAATGILNIGGTSLITGLTATAVGNVVNYTGAAAQTIKATTYATLNFSGAGVKTNTGIVTVNTALTGTAMTNGATGTLNIGGTSTITTLTATAVGNTVNYNGVAAQTVKTTNYYNLTVTKAAGIAATTAAGTVNVTGVLTVTSGTLNIAGSTIAVTGATNVSGTLGITNATGTKTFASLVTVNAGGVWNNSINELVTFRGGITHNGTTFTAGTGTQTFAINSQAIGGASPINFGGIVAVVGAVTVTNNNTNIVTIAGNLTGSAVGSTWVNAANSTLNYGGAAAPMGTRVFTASAAPNTVNYNRSGAQAVKATTYHHLQLTSVAAGAKTAAAGLTVNGDFTMSGAASFTAGTFTHNFAGNWIVNTTAAAPLSVATTSIINFNTPAVPAPTSVGGTTAATIAFADVNINNTSGVTFNDNASFSTGTTPTLTVAAGATLTPAAAVIISGTGTLTGTGTVQVTRITAGTANFSSQYTIVTKTLTNLTVDYAGAAAQTVSVLTYGSATGGGLKVNNASGVSLTANTTVAGTLTLASGVVNAGAFTLISGGDCTTKVARTGGHVAGLLQLAFPTGAPNCTFHVGDATIYRPINASFASVTVAGNLAGSVSQAAGEHPNIATSGLDSTKDVNRYWTLTNPVGGTIAYTTYTAAFNFISPTDFDAGANPANFEIERWDGAAWNVTTLGAATSTSTSASGLPFVAVGSSNSFAVGEKPQPIVVSINRAAADPTNAASVSWTVTFNKSVTGVNSGNFALVNVGLGGAPAITSVIGGGTTWTVTASTGTGDGTLGLNMVNSTGVSPAITGLPFTGQVYTIDKTAPVVSSIMRANPNPTSQASVSWTVTFSESVTGADTTDFALVQAGGVSGAAITSVIGGGTSWTVTASTGVGQGTLGLNLVDDDTIVDIVNNPLGGTGAGNGNFSGELYNIVSATIVTASPTACTNVAGIGTQVWGTLTGPLANDNLVYATASVDGTITNFLQCIGYGFAIPVGATINGIMVNVDRKSSSTANGGSKDAAMRIVKAGVIDTNLANDRSTATIYTVADVIEAHGGAADLWGTIWTAADINNANFGAAFAATKASAAGPPHTVSVDHMQIGISYTALPHHYELSLPTSGIACLPVTVTVKACADNSSPCTNTYPTTGSAATLSTSAGTLGSTTVFFNAGVASTTLSYPAAADGAVASVTLSGEQIAATNPRQCCPDGVSCAVANSCSATFNTAGFILSGAADGAAATVPTQVAGQSSVPYYLRAVKTSTTTKACETALAGANSVNFAYECNNPATCYAANLMSVNGGTATTIARNNNGSVVSYTPVNMTFDANGNAQFTFNYSDVGQVTLHALKAAGGALLSALAGSSNAFVVKPGGFVLSGIQQTAAPNTPNSAAANATGAKFIKAGEAFTATVTATTIDGVTPTPNYGQETAPESVKLASALVTGLGLANNPVIGGTFGAFASGAATGTAFTWNEAGIITLTPSVADVDYLGTGDVTGTTTGNVGRFYAAQFVLTPSPIANRTGLGGICAAPAGCDTFTYMGEQMSAVFTLTAQAVDGTTTLLNYNWSATPANQFAKLNPIAAVTSGTGGPLEMGAVDSAATRTPFPPCGVVPAHPCITPAQASTGTFASGVADITVPFTIYRDNTAVAGPYAALDVAVAPQDSDGVIMAAYDRDTVNVVAGTPNHTLIGQTMARYGRMKLSNAHGSELLPLTIAVMAQYWNGATYITNTLDNNSTFAAADVVLSNPQKNLALNETSVVTPPVSVVFTGGVAGYRLAKPSGGDGQYDGSVDMTVSIISAYLPGNTARATFGVYKGNNEFIYLREIY